MGPEEPPVAKGTRSALASAQPLMLRGRSRGFPQLIEEAVLGTRNPSYGGIEREAEAPGEDPTAETGIRIRPFLSLSAPWALDWPQRSGISTRIPLFVSLHLHLCVIF